MCVFYCYCWELSFFPLERGSHKNYWIHILDISSCFRMTGNGRSRRILRPVYSFHHKSMKETRKKIYQESRITGNTPDLLSKYYSSVRDIISLFDWYEANLCAEVSAITKVRIKFIRVACSTECDILVLVCDRIILDVLRKNPTTLKKNPLRKTNRKQELLYIFTFLSFRQHLKYQLKVGQVPIL